MARILALLLALWLTGCEPCAFVMGGHCQDREQNEDEDIASTRCPAPANTPAPLLPRVPRARGSARG